MNTRIKSGFDLSDNIQFGIKYERRACYDLRKAGFKAELMPNWIDNFDVLGTKGTKQAFIEVKASACHIDGATRKAKIKKAWKFNLTKIWYENLVDIDFPVMLYCDRNSLPPVVFIVPASEIRKRGIKAITLKTTRPMCRLEDYNGWLKPFMADFSQVENLLA